MKIIKTYIFVCNMLRITRSLGLRGGGCSFSP